MVMILALGRSAAARLVATSESKQLALFSKQKSELVLEGRGKYSIYLKRGNTREEMKIEVTKVEQQQIQATVCVQKACQGPCVSQRHPSDTVNNTSPCIQSICTYSQHVRERLCVYDLIHMLLVSYTFIVGSVCVCFHTRNLFSIQGNISIHCG